MTLADDVRAYIGQQAAIVTPKSGSDAAYTGSGRAHYGLAVPEMRAFVQAWAKAHDLDDDGWLAALDALYAGESFEEKCFGGLVLARYPRFRRALSLDRLHAWIGQLEGWNEVDVTCQSVFGAAEMLARWDEWEAFLRALATDAHPSRRRAALVLLVLPIRETADARIASVALDNVTALAGEKDRLISKAVSWVLREGIKRHRTAIQAYLDAHQGALPAFVVREVRKKLETGKK